MLWPIHIVAVAGLVEDGKGNVLQNLLKYEGKVFYSAYSSRPFEEHNRRMF